MTKNSPFPIKNREALTQSFTTLSRRFNWSNIVLSMVVAGSFFWLVYIFLTGQDLREKIFWVMITVGLSFALYLMNTYRPRSSFIVFAVFSEMSLLLLVFAIPIIPLFDLPYILFPILLGFFTFLLTQWALQDKNRNSVFLIGFVLGIFFLFFLESLNSFFLGNTDEFIFQIGMDFVGMILATILAFIVNAKKGKNFNPFIKAQTKFPTSPPKSNTSRTPIISRRKTYSKTVKKFEKKRSYNFGFRNKP